MKCDSTPNHFFSNQGHRRQTGILCTLLLFLSAAFCFATEDERINLDPPPDGTYIIDTAGIVSPEDRSLINRTGHRLKGELDTPVVVVTVNTMQVFSCEAQKPPEWR